MTCGGEGSISQNFSFLAPMVWNWRHFEDLEEKSEVMNQSMNDKGVRVFIIKKVTPTCKLFRQFSCMLSTGRAQECLPAPQFCWLPGVRAG